MSFTTTASRQWQAKSWQAVSKVIAVLIALAVPPWPAINSIRSERARPLTGGHTVHGRCAESQTQTGCTIHFTPPPPSPPLPVAWHPRVRAKLGIRLGGGGPRRAAPYYVARVCGVSARSRPTSEAGRDRIVAACAPLHQAPPPLSSPVRVQQRHTPGAPPPLSPAHSERSGSWQCRLRLGAPECPHRP